MKGFGVDVTVIEPALIRTSFRDVIARDLGGSTPVDGTYSAFNRAVSEASVRFDEQGFLARLGGPPEAVADRILEALEAHRPRARYTVTASARVLLGLRSLLPDSGWDRMRRSSFPSPRRR